MAAPSRSTIGPRFSEGARLLWVKAILLKGHSQETIRDLLGAPRGVVSRWLYGDRKPSLKYMEKARKVYRVPVATWLDDPTERFCVADYVVRSRSKRARKSAA